MEEFKPICNICNCSEVRLLYSIPDLLLNKENPIYNIFECKKCGLQFYTPKLTEKELLESYPINYSQITFSVTQNIFINLYKKIMQWKYYKFLGVKLNNKNVLEVGCSHGNFLKYLKKAGGNVYGIVTIQ